MKASSDIAACLQLGTRRIAPPRSAYLADWQGINDEHTALVEAGTLDLIRRASTCGLEVVPLEAAPRETRPAVEEAAPLLKEALASGLNQLAIEWAERAAAQGAVAPPNVVYQLLQSVSKHPKILGALGERGRWLAEISGIELKEEHPTTPAELRSEIDAGWDSFDWKERARAIEGLVSGLSLLDEPLLMRGVVDRRKEVREPSAKLLARLNESAFSREITAVARNCVQVERKMLGKMVLVVHPPEPESLPKMVPRTAAYADFGPKAMALYDVLRFVHPSFWERLVGCDPETLLALADKNEYYTALREGWVFAAKQTFADMRWVDALFAHYVRMSEVGWSDLLTSVSDETLEKVLLASKDSNDLYTGVSYCGRALSPKLSLATMNYARYGFVDHKEIVFRLDLSILSSLETPWPDDKEHVRQHWLRVLTLRQRLLRTLHR